MRRTAPRPLAAALERVSAGLEPPSLLARVQACWREVAGEAVAEEAEPVAEHGGAVTVACRSAVWAHELELLAPDLVEQLNATLSEGGTGPGPVTSLRFSAGRRAPRRRP